MSCKDISAAGVTRARDNAHIWANRYELDLLAGRNSALDCCRVFGHLTHLHNAHAKKAWHPRIPEPLRLDLASAPSPAAAPSFEASEGDV